MALIKVFMNMAPRILRRVRLVESRSSTPARSSMRESHTAHMSGQRAITWEFTGMSFISGRPWTVTVAPPLAEMGCSAKRSEILSLGLTPL